MSRRPTGIYGGGSRDSEQRVEGKLRLLLLSDGDSAHTIRWTKALLNLGHDVLLFSLSVIHHSEFEGLQNLRVESLGLGAATTYATDGSASKWIYIKALPRIRRLFKEFSPHVAHAHYASSYGVLAALAGLRPRLVSVWGADVFTTPYLSSFHRGMVWFALRTADLVTSTSFFMRLQAKRICDRDVVVVPFGIDTKRFCPVSESGADDSTVVIGTIKSLEIKYGLDILLRAYSLVRRDKSLPSNRMVIFGKGKLREELEALCAKLGLTAHVEFRGSIAYADAHKAHQELDIAVYPSVEDSESFGVSVIESQACGKAVIVSRVGGLPEVVIENVTGLIVPSRDEKALAQAIAQLIKDRGLREKLGRAGRCHVVSRYGLDACASSLVQQYTSLKLDR